MLARDRYVVPASARRLAGMSLCPPAAAPRSDLRHGVMLARSGGRSSDQTLSAAATLFESHSL
jgi:hypothetical protein